MTSQFLRATSLVGLIILLAALPACDKEPGANDDGRSAIEEGRRAGGDALVSSPDGKVPEAGETQRRVPPPDVAAELPDRSSIPPSSLQKCLCYPTGDKCEIESICVLQRADIPDDPSRAEEAVEMLRKQFNMPEMACPEGEVCTGDYSVGLQEKIDEGYVGRCFRLCSASRRDYAHPNDSFCNELEVCQIEFITWGCGAQYNNTKVAVCRKPDYDVFPVPDVVEPESDVYPK